MTTLLSKTESKNFGQGTAQTELASTDAAEDFDSSECEEGDSNPHGC